MRKLIAILLFLTGQGLIAQDLMDMLEEGDEETTEYTYATFKTTRVINGQSIENPPKGALNFVISHHFGRINEGWYEFWGLDQANIRFGFEYGITDWLAIGIGRTSVEKTYDGSLKLKLLRQSKGLRNMPITLSYYGDISCTSLKWTEPERENYFSSRLEYLHQLLIARKFGSRVSVQLVPTYIHRNLVETADDQNDVWAIGAGGRVKISTRVAITGEYYYVLPGETADDYYNSFSIGVDLETGGHVFQIFLTNSQGLIGQQFIPETTGQWGKGDIHLGFNINRMFQIVKPKVGEE
jgi:opacity protein-like surface antigen